MKSNICGECFKQCFFGARIPLNMIAIPSETLCEVCEKKMAIWYATEKQLSFAKTIRTAKKLDGDGLYEWQVSFRFANSEIYDMSHSHYSEDEITRLKGWEDIEKFESSKRIRK